MAEPALRAEALGWRGIVAGVSLCLHPGEVVGVVGPNGAGKSTLLRMLAGLLRPDAGQVALEGRTLAAWPARERARLLGFLPQHFAPHWDYAVRDLLCLGLERGGRAAPAPAVNDAAARFGMEALLGRRWSALSGGERARALAAAVLAPAPRVVLADEPAAALDVGQAKALMRRLRAAAGGGAAVGVVAHDLNLAIAGCDRLLLLAGGRLLLDAPAAEAATSPLLDESFGLRFARLRGPAGRVVLVPA